MHTATAPSRAKPTRALVEPEFEAISTAARRSDVSVETMRHLVNSSGTTVYRFGTGPRRGVRVRREDVDALFVPELIGGGSTHNVPA